MKNINGVITTVSASLPDGVAAFGGYQVTLSCIDADTAFVPVVQTVTADAVSYSVPPGTYQASLVHLDGNGAAFSAPILSNSLVVEPNPAYNEATGITLSLA